MWNVFLMNYYPINDINFLPQVSITLEIIFRESESEGYSYHPLFSHLVHLRLGVVWHRAGIQSKWWYRVNQKYCHRLKMKKRNKTVNEGKKYGEKVGLSMIVKLLMSAKLAI